MRKCLLFFFTFISIFNYSQKIKGIIKNSENKPIENARIGIENENIGDLTDSNGNFNVDFTNIDKSKKIIVLVSEYLPYQISIQNFINSDHKIILEEKVVKIDEVRIEPKKYKSKNLGTSNSKRAYCGY